MKIQFQFDPEKTVQAAAFLIKLNQPEPMNYMGLLKMLYIADRHALELMDWPITGDKYFSLQYGPVLSGVLDMAKEKRVRDSIVRKTSCQNPLVVWRRHIARVDKDAQEKKYTLVLVSDPGTELLCEEEERILKEVYQKFGHLDPFKVVEWTHDLPEWRNPGKSRLEIDIEELLRYLHKTDDEIMDISNSIDCNRQIDEVLAGCV